MATRSAALAGLAVAMTIGGPYELRQTAPAGDPPQSEDAKTEALRRADAKRARRAEKRARINSNR